LSKEIGITVSKKDDFSEWYTQVVIKADLADYAPVKGLIVLKPDGYSIWESIKTSIDTKLKKTGHRNGFLPVLIPESLLSKEKKHFAGFNPEAFWVTHSGNTEIGDRLALRPTSETLAYSLYSKWIKSWRDLPLKINFWNTALRAEIKATRPFLRNSEFLWQEGHTAHTTKKDAEDEVMEILDIYKKTIEEELAIPVITGKKSEKEKFVGAVYTTTLEALMPDGKALQMGTSHFLGRNFSEAFEIKFLDKNNEESLVWQTSWGVSWRLIGGMIMTHGDEKGLVLPPNVAPIQVVIIPIYYSNNDAKNILDEAKKIEKDLKNNNIRVHVDKRDELTPGFKFHDWELKGIPIRVEIGPKDVVKKKIVMATRHNQKKTDVEMDNLEGKISEELNKVQNEMFNSAKKMLEQKTIHVTDYQKFKSGLDNGCFVYAPWCGNQKCEESIKEETGADIRLITFNSQKIQSACVYCNAMSTSEPIFARGY